MLGRAIEKNGQRRTGSSLRQPWSFLAEPPGKQKGGAAYVQTIKTTRLESSPPHVARGPRTQRGNKHSGPSCACRQLREQVASKTTGRFTFSVRETQPAAGSGRRPSSPDNEAVWNAVLQAFEDHGEKRDLSCGASGARRCS